VIFENPKIVQYYAQHADLTPTEEMILRDHQGDFVNKRVLDLGVGAGRTVPWLAPSAASYVGVDYSDAMIEQCRTRFPHYRFEYGDARDLARFAAGAFDFALFSFNGIDFVGHEDRQTILREAARVLVVEAFSCSAAIACSDGYSSPSAGA
jgi:ubiquinone/menaquinone biosynthesis C-methylase UbiE